ncbi:sel1 repeat family protein [Alistipes onderdonkii]|nr:sel1 repeat family protein [Alistipes onderdonkii]
MKHDIIILLGILLIGCQSQSQQSDSESDDLLYEQYWQFQESMLFGIGDEDTAIESLFKSAEAGYAESQSQLGGCYAYRPDLIKREGADIDSAVIWWLKAAEQEDYVAQKELAIFHVRMKEWKQAKYWLKRAEKNGFEDETLYHEIRGYERRNVQPIPKDSRIAVKQYYQFLSYVQSGCKLNFDIKNLIESAESGYVHSQTELGCCYAYCPDLLGCEKPNIDSAVIWWHKAAGQDDWVAQEKLANHYADIQDWKQAKYWLKRAKKNGYKNKELQKKINKHL